MGAVARLVGNAAQKKYKADFTTVKGILQTRLDGMTPAQRQGVVNVLNDWSNATTNNKLDALLACVALLYVVVFLLAHKVIDGE